MSTSARLAVFAGATVVLVGLVVGGILLARDDDEPPSDYDAQIEDDFMATCTADADAGGFDHPDDFCACAYDAIQRQVPFGRFLEIDDALRDDPTLVPPVIDRIRSRCFVEIEGPGQAPPATTLTTVPS